jgi:hypothetical protein
MTEDERIVREVWQDVRYDGHRVLAHRPNSGEWILSNNVNYLWEKSHYLNAPAAWQAARAYTDARRQQIAEVEAEIECIQCCIDMSGITEPERGIPEQQRILARERAALATLKQGMRDAVKHE